MGGSEHLVNDAEEETKGKRVMNMWIGDVQDEYCSSKAYLYYCAPVHA